MHVFGEAFKKAKSDEERKSLIMLLKTWELFYDKAKVRQIYQIHNLSSYVQIKNLSNKKYRRQFFWVTKTMRKSKSSSTTLSPHF
jgi:hypothetical protein